MDVAYDMNKPQMAKGLPKVAFNTFLEGMMKNGTVSNCMTCHRRAALGVSDQLAVFRGEIDKGNKRAFPPDAVRTDFVWSVARNTKTCK